MIHPNAAVTEPDGEEEPNEDTDSLIDEIENEEGE